MSAAAPVRYLIDEPAMAQSLAIVRLLRAQRPEAAIVGIAMRGEFVGGARRAYDEIIAETAVSTQEGDIRVPTGVSSTARLIERDGEIALGEIVMTRESLRFMDKPAGLELAAAAGVPTPATWRDREEIAAWPVFYKSAVEADDRVRGIAHSPDELPSGELIFQEVVAGRGVHGVGFLARDGVILSRFAHFETESYPRLGGSAAIIERSDEARAVAYTEALVRESGYSGWGLAEYKYCPRREDFLFMEVNTKFWASVEFAFLNQPGFARLLFGLDTVPPSPQRMIFMERALRRGPALYPAVVRALARGAISRVYPGWPRQVAAAFTPSPLLAAWRRIRRR